MSYMAQDDDESLDDDSDEDSESADENGSTETVPCPCCRKPVYEQAELCPHCGNYILMQDAPNRKPLWMIVTAVATLAAIALFWVLRRNY